MPGGAETSRTGNTARTLMRPLASTLSRSLPPASATTRTPGRASSPLGSLSISRPGWAPAPLSGLLAASKVGKSATKRTVWPVTRSSRPKASAPGPNCWRVCGPPNGPLTSTYCLAPVSETSDGPSAKLPPAWATDGRPVRTRCWVPRQIRVTAPLGPKQTSAPSGPGAQGPGPPAPASATYRAPSWPKAMPRGLSSPLATTRRPPAAVAAVAVLAAAAPNGDCGAADACPPQQLVHGDQLLARLGLVRSPPGPIAPGLVRSFPGRPPIDTDRPWSVPGVRHHRRTSPLRLVVATIVRLGYPQRRAGAGAAHPAWVTPRA